MATAPHGLILSAVALVQKGPNILPSGHELMFATNVMGPIADLMLSHRDRGAINGALFKLDKRVENPDKAMNDEVSRSCGG